MLYLKGLILIILIGIAWQDYKFRAVYWWLFLLLALTLGVLKSITVGLEKALIDFAYNLGFLSVQLAILSFYFCIKYRKPVNIFNRLFGLGDLFFLVSIATYFSLLNYVVFYMVSLFFVLTLNFIKRLLKQNQPLTIPLAGEQSMFLAMALLATQFNSITDLWIINLVS